MGYLLKYFSLAFILFFLSSCSLETLSPKASKQEQEQVKQEVLSILEKEYNQPFKILDFNYDYKFHYKVSFLVVVGKRYGTYTFKLRTVNKPILSSTIKLTDMQESPISNFKELYLKNFYCGTLASYYKHGKLNSSIRNNGVEQVKKYCDERGQSYYKKWQ
ncbi:hypothetical protein LO80_06975 [Candidatus Francisella endociliophora]|uniref:Lipoprotein n=1 Tax=Candidatus Francisella endociliophora TaxID=653937 RepID=A0A097EQ86_9GAMM|nr:hypothetical protein [Francisella sp. FSC1006]AIT09730.1 hypothetical protein LO80_06975 [Francisella sp. FSC1006]